MHGSRSRRAVKVIAVMKPLDRRRRIAGNVAVKINPTAGRRILTRWADTDDARRN